MSEPSSGRSAINSILIGMAGALGVVAVLALIGYGVLTFFFLSDSNQTPVAEEPENPAQAADLPLRPGGDVIAVPVDVPIMPAISRPVNVELILDASGSMNNYLDGQPRIVVAQDVLLQIVNDMPDSMHTGLMVYGHTVPGDFDVKEDGCQDIEQLVPVSDLDRELILNEVYDVEALGWTPITLALELAADELPEGPDQDNAIVLISDGIETCDRDPIAMAEALHASGIAVDIHVIAFAIEDEDTRQQLMAVAASGNGNYKEAFTAQELADALATIFNDIQNRAEAADEVAEVPSDTPTATEDADAAPAEAPTRTPRPTFTEAPPPSATPLPSSTPLPSATPLPSNTPLPTNTSGPTNTPTATFTPTKDPNAGPVINEFYASAAAPGSGIRYYLNWDVTGASRVEIFGNVMDNPQNGSWPIYNDANWWVLWATDDAGNWVEQGLQVDTDSIYGAGFSNVSVNSTSVIISVRDNQTVDGDIISLSVNGQPYLRSHTLSGDWYDIQVKLSSGQNTITVTALNEGSASPNTVEIKISNVIGGSAAQVSRGLYTGQSESLTINAP